MLTPDEIQRLASKPVLTEHDVYELLETLILYMDANEIQSKLLKQAIDELTSLRARVEFYRKTTVKLV